MAAAQVQADSIDDLVRTELKQQRIPAIAVAVVKGGKVIKEEAYGYANVELGVSATPKTVFQSGSVGKQFTAMAAMLLVEAGKLRLDDPVSKYLTDAPAGWKDIRLRHLLTHTSGLAEYTDRIDLKKSYTEDALLKLAFAAPLIAKPGERWKYCNAGYAVLGILESRVAGQFYGDFMKERIFRPLGMDTARIISEADIIPNRAAGYHFVEGELKNQEWVSPELNTTGDGSLYLTLGDMVRWDAALTAGKLISKEGYEQMWTAVKTADGKDQGYGFGWSIGTVNGHRRISHSGAWQGFSSSIARYPADQLTVIVFMNCAPAKGEDAPGGRPRKLAEDIAVSIIPDLAAKTAGPQTE
jgi:CubicO group peptidase (beta-lactamase class C family)